MVTAFQGPKCTLVFKSGLHYRATFVFIHYLLGRSCHSFPLVKDWTVFMCLAGQTAFSDVELTRQFSYFQFSTVLIPIVGKTLTWKWRLFLHHRYSLRPVIRSNHLYMVHMRQFAYVSLHIYHFFDNILYFCCMHHCIFISPNPK